jgi:oligopeptide transport system substrate-binding protein
MLALALCLIMVVGVFAACQPKEPEVTPATFKQAEYNTTTSVMPSNWNEFTYADNNDTQIMSYIGSSFFEYDYKFADDKKFNADGSINKEGIVAGAYTTNYSAATKLEDVTSSVDAKWGYTAEQKAEGGYAWKITLRDDLKWDDGTAITAADFVYSMKQLLDPAFMNFRANTYYDTLMIKNSKVYFFQNQEGTYETIGSQGFASLQAAIDSGKTVYANAWNMWGAEGYLDAEGNECPEWVALTDETEYSNADGSDKVSGKFLYENYGAYLEPGTGYDAAVYVENTNRDVAWESVGIYEVEGENALVLCLDKAYSFLKEDGSLSVWAPYYFSSLPVVHKEKYEASKIAPADGATLWTSNYNSSLATTASWGPYKLAEFEAGSHYKLVKNENWYGWNLEQYKNQYNITAINCRKVEEFATKWMGFLNGSYDDASLQTENVADYLDSKYVYFTSTSTGTFGMQLYSNLSVLKESDNNNGILAIQEFRHAFNLALNRSDIVEKIWPGSAVPCFGLLNVAYYYDIENSPELEDGGQYRNALIAKEGILRAYGFTQGADGKWSGGDLKNLSTEDAYDALTGYNPTLAKQKMQEAIAILTADPEKYGYDATKNITLVYGSSSDTDKQRFRATYLQEVLDDLTKGTALEDKIDVVFDASAGSQWAEAFRTGATQIGFGYGFSGNAFNPFDIIGAFVNPDDSLNYHMYWDTSAIDMTLTMPAGDYAGAGETITMSIQNWYFCLNGLAETENQAKTYNWGEGFAPVEARLMILSALEEVTIKESRSVMLIADGGGSFLGAKFSYFSEDEHTFMGFGGLRYMEVNYTDAEWAAFVAENNNDLSAEYKKSE